MLSLARPDLEENTSYQRSVVSVRVGPQKWNTSMFMEKQFRSRLMVSEKVREKGERSVVSRHGEGERSVVAWLCVCSVKCAVTHGHAARSVSSSCYVTRRGPSIETTSRRRRVGSIRLVAVCWRWVLGCIWIFTAKRRSGLSVACI